MREETPKLSFDIKWRVDDVHDVEDNDDTEAELRYQGLEKDATRILLEVRDIEAELSISRGE